jgi:PEP-CTERM/exosortase A-associated glycosyltransferase
MHRLKKRLFEVIGLEKPHVIHVHSPVLNAVPAILVGKRLNVPVVYEVRATWEDAAVDYGKYGPDSWKYQSVRSLEKLVCHRAAQLIVLSQGLKLDFVERGISSEKITVIGNGVDPKQFAPTTDDCGFRARWNLEGKQVLAFIGSFYRYEGLDLLVAALADLSRRWPKLVLFLAGGGEVENELKRQVADLDLHDRVVIAGRIAHDEVAQAYAAADIFVYPRRSVRLTEIVTPLKPLEAMAMGKAVIASDVGGHRELITHERTGLLFSAGELPALVAGIESLLLSEELRARLGVAANSWVRKERSWKKLIAGHAEVYARALDSGSAVQAQL